MKKKLVFFITLLVAAVLFVPNAFAATKTPEYTTLGGKKVLIANGTPITISTPTTEGKGATVSWEGGSIEVDADASIFGGYHNDYENVVDTSITMNGGTVRNIHGGGLHKSSVETATIIINGGTVTGSLYGGGYEEFTDCGEHDFNIVTEENVANSTTRVETANITVNGGSLYVVFGGGGAHAYTGEVNIVVNDTADAIDYLVAGGSNGYTKEASVTINDGNIEIVQGVNRGSVDSAKVVVEGGSISTIYAGGEDTDSAVNGTILDASITVKGGQVENIKAGTNGGQNTTAGDVAVVTYNKDAVKNIDETSFGEEAVVKTVTLTFAAAEESESIQVPVDFAFTAADIEELKAELTTALGGTGYEIDNFYSDEECTQVYDMTTKFTEDITVYINLVQLRESETTPEAENPNTSDISLYGTIIAILLAAAGLGYTIKKRKFN